MKNAVSPMRLHRKAKSITLAGLSEKVGASIGHLSKVENGEAQPSLGLAMKISQEIGVPVAELAKSAAA